MGGFQEQGTLIMSVFWDISTSAHIMPYHITYILHTLFAFPCHLPMSYMLPEKSQKFATAFGEHLVIANMPPRKKRSHMRKCLPKMLRGKSTLKGVCFSL